MRKQRIAIILCLILSFGLLSGCSSVNSNFTSASKQSEELSVSRDDVDYGSASSLDMEANDSDVDASENEIYTDTAGETEQTEEITSSKKEQKLVYTCDMTMETLEYEKTLESIKQQITKYNGIIEQETSSDSNSYWYNDSRKSYGTLNSYLVIRIPSDHYQTFLTSLEGNGKITSQNMQVENITKHYSEVETTIKSLKTQEERLLSMMEKAETVEDMITVETRLTEVQNELAQYKNSLSALDTDIAYSTINLSINEVVKYEAAKETFMDRLHSTLGDSADLFVSFLEGLLFAAILYGPVLLVLLIIIAILFKVFKGISEKKKKNNSKKSLKSTFHKKNKESKIEDQKTSEE